MALADGLYLLLRGSRLSWYRRPKLEGKKNTVDVCLVLLDFLYITCNEMFTAERTK